jgi:ApaG protein
MSAQTLSDAAAPVEVDHGVRVSVTPAFAPEHSDASASRHVFTYTVTIVNGGDAPAQLVSRHWVIIDADGKREDVEGTGVVGKTPRLEAGRSFQYQSFCPLKTRWGTMEGSYHMRRDDGTEFDVAIPRFVLHAD